MGTEKQAEAASRQISEGVAAQLVTSRDNGWDRNTHLGLYFGPDVPQVVLDRRPIDPALERRHKIDTSASQSLPHPLPPPLCFPIIHQLPAPELAVELQVHAAHLGEALHRRDGEAAVSVFSELHHRGHVHVEQSRFEGSAVVSEQQRQRASLQMRS